MRQLATKMDGYHSPDYVYWDLGKSVEGRTMQTVVIGPHSDASTNTAACDIPHQPARASYPWLMFLAGMNGNEPESVWLVEEARSIWTNNFKYRLLGTILWEQVNPDGLARKQRANARGVELNCNLPTRDWKQGAKKAGAKAGPNPASEPECEALRQLVDVCRPCTIVSVHTADKPALIFNGPAQSLAQALSKSCGYPVTREPHQQPGSLAAYAGIERAIPTISLMIPRGLPRQELIHKHMPALESALQYWESRL